MGPMRIGVLGGIGPEATGIFYLKLIKKLQESGLITRNEDFPQIIINSIPAPELISDQIKDSELEVYRQGLKELDSMNLDFIVMVCNTIHLYREMFQLEIKTKIFDLQMALKRYLSSKNITSILILGTPQTIKCGLYKFPGIKNYEPTRVEMDTISKAVFDFNRGTEKSKQVETIREICQYYIFQSIELVILGCTELAVMLEQDNLPKIDPMEVMIDMVIDKVYKRSLNNFWEG